MITRESVDAALASLQPSLGADGFTLEIEAVGSDSIHVVLSATADACLDCLVPERVMLQIIADAIVGQGVTREQLPVITLVKKDFEGNPVVRVPEPTNSATEAVNRALASRVEIVSPEGWVSNVQHQSARGVSTLRGVTLGVLDNGKPNARVLLGAVAELLQGEYGVANVVSVRKHYSGLPASAESLATLERECAVVITGSGDCGSCTSWTIHDAVELETRGVPCVAVCTDVFEPLGRSEAKALGISDLSIVVVKHPIGNKSPAAVRLAGEQAAGEVADTILGRAAEDARPRQDQQADDRRSARLVVPGDGTELFEEFWRRGWSEGLPVIAPTVERIGRALEYVGRPGDEVIGLVGPRRGIATVETVIANAVMAGCPDQLLPIVLAAIEGICRPDYNIFGVQATTGPVAPMAVVFGPGAARDDVHGGSGCLGPGFRSNATIGRALRLVLWNIGGGRPGVLDQATQGQPAKYALCFAENQAKNPWRPWHEDSGFGAEETVVYIGGAVGTEDVIHDSSHDVEDLAQLIASSLLSLSSNHMLRGGSATLLLCPEHARMFADAGYSRAQTAELVAKDAKVSFSAFPATSQATLRRKRPQLFSDSGDPPAFIPAFDTPEQLQLIVAGGTGPHSLLVSGCARGLIEPQWVPVRPPGVHGSSSTARVA